MNVYCKDIEGKLQTYSVATDSVEEARDALNFKLHRQITDSVTTKGMQEWQRGNTRRLVYVGTIEDSVVIKNDNKEILFLHKEDIAELVESLQAAKKLLDIVDVIIGEDE